MSFARAFSTCSRLSRTGYSTVEPVHHLVKINKTKLKPKYKDLTIPRTDVEAVGYRPTEIGQDRLEEHYENTLRSDLLLYLYQHEAKTVEGTKKRTWGSDSPYALYRPLRKPKGLTRPTRDVHPIGPTNIPRLVGVTINCYNSDALEDLWLNISLRLQLAQITNVKPKQIYARANILQWKLREGKPCGAKVELTGRDMNQFVSTLTELVLPRMRTFKGLKNTSGDGGGNITMGLLPSDVKLFPEIENFQELFPNLFGFHVTLKTSARTDEQARVLLSSMGFPFYSP